jgi:OOP family OmpA-OmpF porin
MATARTRISSLTVFLSTLAVGATSAAAQAPGAAPASPAPAPNAAPASPPAANAEVAATPAPRAEDDASTPWIRRYRPVKNSWELGIYGGAFLPSYRHEFYAPDLTAPDLGHQRFARAGFDLGARVGYYPLRVLGLELEGGVVPTKTERGQPALLYTFRPVALLQLPYRIAPFARVGFGLVGVSSDALGKDIDPSLNVGGGVKFYVNQLVALRLDVVDNIATARGVGNGRSNNMEFLLGLSLRLGAREKPKDQPAALRDTDRDGLYDPGQVGVARADEDACPEVPGPRENRGCPLRDSDGDGFYDPDQSGTPPGTIDACPAVRGIPENQGCPLIDSDGDRLYDPGQPVAASEIDDCPNEPGPRALQGCPDRDKDLIADRIDKCPDAPEVYNQIDDRDGCPDEVPRSVKTLAGVIEGIYFDVDKDTIKPRSRKVLDRAVAVLKEHSTTRWQIEGHTDSDGAREHNMDLSQRRADSVKRYLVEHGVDEARLVAKGFGPDQPIDTNATSAGKAKNRRIEFKLID